MTIMPLRTLPLRVGLKVTSRRNAISRKRLAASERKYAPWALMEPMAHMEASLSSEIHPYPGLGHQLSGWISGQLWARDLGLDYAGGILTQDDRGLFDFSTSQREEEADGTGFVRLSSVNDERDPRGLTVLQGQIRRNLNKSPVRPIRFRLALDQARWNQTPAADAIRASVLGGSYGSMLRQIEQERPPYVALHIRRGDVFEGLTGGSTGLLRWVDERWYVELVHRLRRHPELQDLEVRAYALGQPEDFPALKREGITLRVNGDRDLDFVELCGARVLVAAPSSFSFSAGLASRGVVVAQSPWWHDVPDEGRWVPADAEGAFSISSLTRAISCTV
jgi:hypothetical protein